MNPELRSFLKAGAALLASSAFPAAHAADVYPSKPVTILVQQSAGSTGDLVARLAADALSRRWKQPVVVENKPGANGMIASSQLVRARPDGYTLLMSGSTPLAFNPHMYASVPYDLRKDFSYIAAVSNSPFVLLASRSAGFKTFEQFVAAARAKPGGLTYGSGGVGNSTHLVMEMIMESAGIQLQHIPYNGVGPAMASLIPGEIQVMTSVLSSAATQIQSGNVIPLAVSGSKRFPRLQEAPAFDELGIKGPPTPGWLVLVGPRGMQQELVDRINADVGEMLKDESIQNRMREYYAEPVGGAPSVARDRFLHEFDVWGKFIKAHGIKAQ